ncbi:hypothetical protein BJV74DRAFT_52843 [Russula compacta]|nr:hypothetical protein BJV74DRAFT_52843 [Russula compacta]
MQVGWPVACQLKSKNTIVVETNRYDHTRHKRPSLLARQSYSSCRSHHRSHNLALGVLSFSFSVAWRDHPGGPASTRECGGEHQREQTKKQRPGKKVHMSMQIGFIPRFNEGGRDATRSISLARGAPQPQHKVASRAVDRDEHEPGLGRV